MRSRDIVGKTVARIEQHRIRTRDYGNSQAVDVKRIIFTDGTWVFPFVVETDSDPVVEIHKGNGRLPTE